MNYDPNQALFSSGKKISCYSLRLRYLYCNEPLLILVKYFIIIINKNSLWIHRDTFVPQHKFIGYLILTQTHLYRDILYQGNKLYNWWIKKYIS